MQPAAGDEGSSTKVVLPEKGKKSSRLPETAGPVLKLYYRRTKIQPAAGDRGSSTCSTRERKSSRPPETAVPVLKLYYQRTKIQPAPETAVPVLKLYYQRTKIQPAAGDDGSSTKAVLPENENPAGRWRRRFQY